MREMKDSGIYWIGDIPANWELLPTKRFFRAEKRVVGAAVDDYDRLALTMQGVIKRSKDDSEGLQPEKFEGYQILRENELVFKLIDLENVKTSRVGLSSYTGLVSPAYIVLTNDQKDNRYFYYWFMFMYYNEVFNQLGGAGVRSALNAKDVCALPMPAIGYEMQKRISDYLDSKCSKIDEIIAKQEKVIEKLKEYKLSVITEAVTKGLNPDVEMNDSGVEWIGRIPLTWTKCRVKNIYKNIKNPVKVGPFGSQLTTTDYVEEGKWVYNQRVVLDHNFKNNDTFISEEKYQEMKGFAVEEGDILITTRGTGTTGHIAKVPSDFKEGILHPCLMRIRLDENKCLYKFLYYVFEFGTYIREQIDFANNTSSLPVLYSYTLNDLFIAIPPVEVQKEIIDYLDARVESIDKRIDNFTSTINKLREYKKSLIYEVVTGKKEV